MTKRIDEEKQEQRNLFVAMLAIIAVLFLSKMFFPTADVQSLIKSEEAVIVAEDKADTAAPSVAVVAIPKAVVAAPAIEAKKIPVQSNLLGGSFTNAGGLMNHLVLTQYHQTSDKSSPAVSLLTDDYWAQMLWTSPDVSLPASGTVWNTQNTELTPFSPVVLTYETDQVRLKRTVALDEGYMMTVTDELTNLTDAPIQTALTGQIHRVMAEEPSRSTVHEGFLGFLDGRLTEELYSAVKDEAFSKKTTGGWMGLTDKYWQTLFVFDKNQASTVEFMKDGSVYHATFKTPAEAVQPAQTLVKTTRLFAGAKDMDLIAAYEKNLGIPRFDLSIDFGWFYFLTKPFMIFLNWLYAMVGNMGIAILIFATLLRIALLPIATKSYESMAKMRKIQPKMKALQERYKNDRPRLQQELMTLYKKDKVNPASGCLPMLLQIPVFFALYKVLSVSIHMRQAPFFGWIQDLSMPDGSSVLTAFGYVPWPIPGILDIGVWPVLMGITMWIQQKLNPAPMDKSQATMFKLMPIIFTFMLGNFAAGLVIYWTWSNVLSIVQQKYIMKKVGV